MIRDARHEEFPLLREIERAAGAPFRALGMDSVADAEPAPLVELAASQRAGRLWVFTDLADRPIACLQADVVDANGHVEQVSVHPDQAHRGRGRDLLTRPTAGSPRPVWPH